MTEIKKLIKFTLNNILIILFFTAAFTAVDFIFSKNHILWHIFSKKNDIINIIRTLNIKFLVKFYIDTLLAYSLIKFCFNIFDEKKYFFINLKSFSKSFKIMCTLIMMISLSILALASTYFFMNSIKKEIYLILNTVFFPFAMFSKNINILDFSSFIYEKHIFTVNLTNFLYFLLYIKVILFCLSFLVFFIQRQVDFKNESVFSSLAVSKSISYGLMKKIFLLFSILALISLIFYYYSVFSYINIIISNIVKISVLIYLSQIYRKFQPI